VNSIPGQNQIRITGSCSAGWKKKNDHSIVDGAPKQCVPYNAKGVK